MKFKKEDLKELSYYGAGEIIEDFQVVYNRLVGSGRWELQYEQVFLYEGKYYMTYFDRGATEMQDNAPYEWESDEIELSEVFPREETNTVYEPAK